MSESIWKKEITFRRKPKTAPVAKAESRWKKEISFKRVSEVSDQVVKDDLVAAVRRKPKLTLPTFTLPKFSLPKREPREKVTT